MLLTCGTHARAGETNAPALTPEQAFEGGTKSYNNWVELGVGGLFTSGSTAQAQQQYRLSNDPFGGVSDLHLQKDVAKNTTLTMDGHALFDQNDYKLILGLQREDFGYIKLNLTDFRTWYNGAGGFYDNKQYQLPNDELSLDRGTLSVEAGLTPKDLPKVVFKYTHSYRDGDKNSTIWGPVHPDLLNSPSTVRNVFPSLYNINEKVDTFALDVTHHIKTTDFGAGVRYDTASLSDKRQESFYPDETQQRAVTDTQGTSYDLLNAHAFSETWIKKNLFFSAGYSFVNQHDTFSGSRIYGDDFGVAYSPNQSTAWVTPASTAARTSRCTSGNFNLMTIPVKNLSIVPSLRVESDGLECGFRRHRDVRQQRSPTLTGAMATGTSWTCGNGSMCDTPA